MSGQARKGQKYATYTFKEKVWLPDYADKNPAFTNDELAKAIATKEEDRISPNNTHNKSPRIQQHPASAFTAAIQKAKRTRQAQTGKTAQIYRQHKQEPYSNPCSSVGTRMPARNPVPLDFACIPRHAW
jgi:hypothetical protein